MSTSAFWESATQQYKYQAQGAVLVVAFQLFALAFIYLMSWNYKLISSSLTPMLWAVLISLALHGIKTSMVQYLINFDLNLKKLINPKVIYFQKNHPILWWLPSAIITIIYRMIYVSFPIFNDMKRNAIHHARRFSSNSALLFQLKDLDSDADSDVDIDTDTDDNDNDADTKHSLNSFLCSQSGFADNEESDSFSQKKQKQKKLPKIRKIYNVSSSFFQSQITLFVSFFVVLCGIIFQSDVVNNYLVIYEIVASLFIFVFVVSFICLSSILIPSWGKNTYNLFVVIILITLIIGTLTLITGVILFKIADEATRFAIVTQQVVDNSELFRDLHIDLYINETAKKVLQSFNLSDYLSPEINEELFKQILTNDNTNINWMETFTTLFSGDTKLNNTLNTDNITVNDTFILDESLCSPSFIGPYQQQYAETCYITSVDQVDDDDSDDSGGLMDALSGIMSGNFDVINLIKKLILSIFGRSKTITTIINLDFHDYIRRAQNYGLDLPFAQKILLYMQQFITLISTNIFVIISLLLSFGSWIIHLGLDFMVFLACLFYLLLDSESIFAQITKIVSIIPSPNISNTPHVSFFNVSSRFGVQRRNQHFLNSLFKSIQDIFVVTFKIFLLHAFVTWFSFTIFEVDFGFVTAFCSGIFSIIPYFPPWLICLHGVIYLMYQKYIISGLLMLGAHVALLWIDPMLMERIENAHPYLTGTSIVLGLTQFGISGFIVGPLLVCLTSWSLTVIAFYCNEFATPVKKHASH